MPVTFGSPIDLQKLELQNAVIHSLATAPASPSEGQIYFNTADDNLYVYDGSGWVDLTAQGATYTAGTGITLTGSAFSVNYGTTSGTAVQGNDARIPTTDEKAALGGTSGSPSGANKYVTNGDSRLTDSRAPSGSAGGDLAGTYPNPTIAAGVIVDADVSASAAIAESKLSLASDAAAGTASRRTLGTGATQATAGNDSRLTDSRTPSGSAGGDLSGTYPNPTIGTGKVTSTHILDGTIANADINASAAIALSKLASDPLARANHTGTQTASTVSDFDTAVRTSRLDQMAAPTASISANSQKITSLADGTSASDAVNKGQLDAAQNGLDVKASVRAATTANITISTALNSGDTLDGVTLSNGDRVLVKDQTSKAENGIWVVAATPARATDADAAGELSGGAFVFVEEGTANADVGYVVTTNGSITPGTTAHDWAVFSRAGELVAGDGISKTGATLAVDSTVARRNAANTFTGQVEASHATNPAFKVATGHGSGAALDANGEGKIIGVVDPTSAQDAATKAYVDAQTGGGQYAASIGDGSATTITVTHSLGTRDVVVQVYRNSGNYDEVMVETRRTTTSAVDLVFAVAPTSNQYRVVVRK